MKLYLIDYNGVTCKKNHPVGHTLGVAKTFLAMFRDCFDLIYVAPKPYLDIVDAPGKLALPKHINPAGNNVDKDRIVKANLKFINQNCTEGILFFCHFHPAYSRYLPKPNVSRKITCVCFSHVSKKKPWDNFLKGVMRKIYSFRLSKHMRRAEIVFKTNRKLNFYHNNEIFVPDYFYDAKKLEPYINVRKNENLVVCLGQNHRHKRLLVEAINAFKKSNKTLHIAGKFFDDEFYCECQKAIEGSSNIVLENKYVSESEYLSLLSKAKFSILPYDNYYHFETTSGVLLDSLFLKTIPVTTKEILEFNSIPGIGYKSLNDVGDVLLDNYDYNEFCEFAGNSISEVYSEDYFKKTFLDHMTKLK